jgi:hypothetical protein
MSLGVIGSANAQPARLTAAEIVNKNVTARGGLQAWHAVQTISMSGKMEAGGNNRPALPVPGTKRGQKIAPARPSAQVELPFRIAMKRGRKLRMELEFNGQTSVQIYDGANGWKLRPFLNRTDYEPYTAEETKTASSQSDLDGPLVDYAAKGTTIESAGSEKVDGRDNYKLKLTLKNGYSFHVWIDAQTFLETKMEGTPRRLDGEYRPVEIYFLDYRAVNGLQIPHVLETRVNSALTVPGKKGLQSVTEKIAIESVVVNPKLDDTLFLKPRSEVATSSPHPLQPTGSSRQQ